MADEKIHKEDYMIFTSTPHKKAKLTQEKNWLVRQSSSDPGSVTVSWIGSKGENQLARYFFHKAWLNITEENMLEKIKQDEKLQTSRYMPGSAKYGLDSLIDALNRDYNVEPYYYKFSKTTLLKPTDLFKNPANIKKFSLRFQDICKPPEIRLSESNQSIFQNSPSEENYPTTVSNINQTNSDTTKIEVASEVTANPESNNFSL